MNRTVLCAILVLFLAETLVLSSNPQRALSTIERNANLSIQNSSLTSSYNNITTHEGDLVIDGTQTFVIENCTYIQTGNIYVTNSGTLVLRNVELRINGTYFWQYAVEASDYGTLEFENVTVWSDHLLAVYCNGFSVVKVDGLTWLGVQGGGLRINDYSEVFVENSTINSVLFVSWPPTENAHAEVADSTIGDIEIMFPQEATTNVNNLTQGFSEYLDLGQTISGNYHTFLELNRTFVNAWRLEFFWDSPTLISNSEIWLGVVVPPGVSVELDDLLPGFYENKQIGEIELNRTTIITAIDVHMEHAEDSLLILTNSVVSLHVGYYSRLVVVNSVINEFDTSTTFVGSVYFDNTNWTGLIMVSFSSFYIGGNVSIEDSGNIEWYSCNITRDYAITPKDVKGGGLISEAALTLQSDGTPGWSGTTDSFGIADFNLTFTDNNYTDTLRLNISKEGFYNETTDVGFFSNTPVSIVLTEKIPGDINLDREVSLADLVLLAQAYGTKPGDPNWNPNADIDGNGVVGLPDLVALAQHYGQRYP
jgi:hypothetical protein